MGRDTWQAIDANAIIDESGTPWLAFGSFWDGIKLVKLKDDNGLEGGSKLHTTTEDEKVVPDLEDAEEKKIKSIVN